ATQYRMPAITLDQQAREVLENYSWPGNIRQLKNVAEQISAIEETRTITAAILEKYLPRANNQPMVVGGERRHEMGDEREILYKVLFDMRADIGELKRMMNEVLSQQQGPDYREIAGLLPSAASSHVPAPVTTPYVPPVAVPEYAESEVVTDDDCRPLTKDEMQREQIVKALKRNNGKRKDAARELFISERTLYRKIKELGIDEF
ncbi:sigma-54-dependent Fis family transcriptional regulator, partial [Alistipes sp. OttesenSCG-928-B03]|nr:sigma-54-dependent Fis family transcriptional regulator [Alistipes sp. OttesenSCG-928-B03]